MGVGVGAKLVGWRGRNRVCTHFVKIQRYGPLSFPVLRFGDMKIHANPHSYRSSMNLVRYVLMVGTLGWLGLYLYFGATEKYEKRV